MKHTISFMVLALILTVSLNSCSKDEDDMIQQPVVDQLTVDEMNGLIYMREEEKLARDVYLVFYDLYGKQNFTNIASSEQQHMDRVLSLLNTYQIADPASPDNGAFNNSDLQSLYNDLIEKGKKSLLDAQIVGETIEDLDIHDLDHYMSLTSKADILAGYEFLSCGSRNHLRAFDSQVKSLGGTYVPQYISQEDFANILNSAHENCNQ